VPRSRPGPAAEPAKAAALKLSRVELVNAMAMLYTCSAEDRSLLSELKKASLNNAEQLDRFFSCLIDQMGASSASDMVQRVLGGSGLAVCFCCNTADQIPDCDYALVNSLPNLRQTRLLKWKNTNKSSKFWR
jgi:DNA-binding helix-hairpin-helix protein with protein kinase domain